MTSPISNSVTSQPIPGGWTRKEVPVGDRRFDLILPADPVEFLNHLENDKGQEPDDPFWAALWPAAPITANLAYAHDWQPGTPALELGCGSGLVGLAALAAGLDVTFSDVIPTAIELALENAHRNGFAEARGQLIDWYQPPDLRFPQILGSDLIYETRDHAALLNTLDRLLTDEGHCWLGDPGRSAAQNFYDSAEDRGYSVRILDAEGQSMRKLVLGQFQLLVLHRGATGADLS